MKLGKQWLLAIPVAVALVASPLVVAEANPVKVGSVNTLQHESRTYKATTKEQKWRRLADRPPMVVVSKGVVSVTVSIDVTGAPVQIRARMDGKVMRPGVASFQGKPGDTSRSFTFVARRGPTFECRNIQVEWRSPTGGLVTSPRSSYALTYREPTEPVNFGCA